MNNNTTSRPVDNIISAMRADLARWNRREERANDLARRINAEMETAAPARFALLSRRLSAVYLLGEVAEREGRNLASALGLIAYYREEVITCSRR